MNATRQHLHERYQSLNGLIYNNKKDKNSFHQQKYCSANTNCWMKLHVKKGRTVTSPVRLTSELIVTKEQAHRHTNKKEGKTRGSFLELTCFSTANTLNPQDPSLWEWLQVLGWVVIICKFTCGSSIVFCMMTRASSFLTGDACDIVYSSFAILPSRTMPFSLFKQATTSIDDPPLTLTTSWEETIQRQQSRGHPR